MKRQRVFLITVKESSIFWNFLVIEFCEESTPRTQGVNGTYIRRSENIPFLYLLKTSENKNFLTFIGEMQMGRLLNVLCMSCVQGVWFPSINHLWILKLFCFYKVYSPQNSKKFDNFQKNYCFLWQSYSKQWCIQYLLTTFDASY